MRYILASRSPRRIELLKKVLNSPFETFSPDIDESSFETNPALKVMDLAYKKALKAFGQLKITGMSTIISCDTTVYMDGEFFDKPVSYDDAYLMLGKLSGKTHEVYSGVCILSAENGKVCQIKLFYDCSQVTFFDLDKQKITKYIQDFKPLDKAGAYGIQDCVLVKKHTGSFDNIVGLPVEKIKEVI